MPTTFVERTTARGRMVFVPRYSAFQRPRVRPSPDRYDKFANRYQVQLLVSYERWAAGTGRIVIQALEQGATSAQATTIVNARLTDLEVELRLLGRQRIAQAAGMGLGRRMGKRISSPGVVTAIARMQAQNDALLTGSLIPGIRLQLAEALPLAIAVPLAGRLTAVREALLKPRSQVGRYSGGAIVATFEIQKQAGIEENEERQARGEKPIPVKWVLDPLADHCEDDPVRGTFGCPSLEGVYPGGWATLPTVPGGNVSCLGNDRCHIEADFGKGWERVR